MNTLFERYLIEDEEWQNLDTTGQLDMFSQVKTGSVLSPKLAYVGRPSIVKWVEAHDYVYRVGNHPEYHKFYIVKLDDERKLQIFFILSESFMAEKRVSMSLVVPFTDEDGDDIYQDSVWIFNVERTIQEKDGLRKRLEDSEYIDLPEDLIDKIIEDVRSALSGHFTS